MTHVPAPDRRIVALDGVRGLMTIFVLVSHYFAELPHGIDALAFGWIAVDVFFVLSGLLVGRLILDKGHHGNFLAVFYLRRVCRTFPIYFVCVAASLAVAALVPAMRAEPGLPLWSYFVFAQNLFMAARDHVGWHWLAPTWTLAVEEQFYIFAPALMLLTPRRHLAKVLVAIALAAVAARVALIAAGASPLAVLALLPTRADNLAIGLLAAVVLLRADVRWDGLFGRLAPVVLLFAAVALRLASREADGVFMAFGHLLVALAAAAFLMSLVHGAPEAARFRGRILAFFGTTSYAVYLIHLPILWALHGAIRGAEPSLADARAVAVTLAALPLTLLAGWALTRFVEEPITAYGRAVKWRTAAAPKVVAAA